MLLVNLFYKNLCPMLRPLTVALLLCLFLTDTNAQYVQTGLPLRDTTVAGVDLQAHDISMSADGNTAVAGYPNSSYSRGGFAIYDRNGNNWNEVFSYYNTGTQRAMGTFADISGDGNTAIVCGANGVYWIYVRQGNTWQLQHTSSGNTGQNPAISYDGNTIILGNKVWVRNNNQWTLESSINQGNSGGFSSVISADGNTAIINRIVSVRQGNTWVQQGAQLVPHIPLYPDVTISSYSFSVLSGDGNTYILGFSGLGSDQLAVFKRTGNVWIQETLLNSSYPGGSDLAISYTGDKLLFAARSGGGFRTKAGKTYLLYWQRTQYTWSAPVISYGDTIQGSYSPIITMRAAMDSSGTQVLVANRFSDSFYGGLRYYTANGPNWQQQGADIFNSQAKGFSWQGNSVTISNDGSTMASAGVKDGYGAVWTYTRNGNKWMQQGQPVTCPEAPDRDRHFAEAGTKCIALSGDGNTMAITAVTDEVYLTYQGQEPLSFGAVYMFNRTAGVWQFSQKITIPNDTTYKWLNGGIVKLSNDGKTLLASSSDKGAWIFTSTSGTWQLQQNLPNLPNADTYQADLSGDGNTAIMVQEVGSSAGRVYVYKRTGTTWQLQQGPILPPNTSQPNFFPVYTVLSNDGKCFGISDIYSSPDKIYLYKDSAGLWVRYGNTCDSTCGSSSITGSGAFCLSSTGDTVYSTVSTNLSVGSIAVDVYVKSGNKWVYVYRATPAENMLPIVATGYLSALGASVAVSGDLKHLALGYPYMDGASGGIYTFIGSNLSVTGTTTNAACPTIANGKVRINVTGGVAPVNIAWSTGAANVDSISNLAVGTYYVTVTDGDNIEVVRQYVINATQTMQLQNAVTNYSCSGNTGNIAASISGGAPPYSFVWSTSPAQTNDTVFNLPAGTYSFTVTDSVGCTYTDSAVLNPNIYWSSLTANQPDCTNNNGSAFMQVHGGTAPYTYSWSNGDTTATINTLAPGTYYVTATDGNACAVTDSVILTPFCVNILQGHLFFDDNNNCVQDSGELNATNYNLYADGLTYYTYGNTDAQGNYSIMVPTPGAFTVKIGNWSNCSFNVCAGGTYPLPVSFSGIGDTITGADFALVDTTYDLTVFTQSDLFNPGFASNVDIQYYNTSGNVVPGSSIDVTYDSLLTFNSAIPAHTIHNPATRTITFNVGNVGPTDTSQHLKLNFTLAAGTNVQNLVLLNCNISPTQSDCNIDNNELEGWIRVAGAYDPNAKESSTDGRIGFADSAIDYTIHFQNTGNDTTHFIVVTDTLPDFLDPASVQTMSTSHTPYTFRLSGEGIVEWRFDPIYLPDSTTDEPNSHGYVTFRTRITNSPPVNTRLENKAHIYFDYNEPIVTNTVTDTVVCIVNGATKQASICTNQTYDFNGRILTTAGTYKTAYRSRFNCDSIVTLVLFVNNSANPSLQLNTAICEGESYSFYGSNLLASGTYTASLPATIGCDTIVTLNLLVYDTAGPVSSASICKGESYLFDGNNLTASGTYFTRLQGAGGCDSVVTLHLQVLDTTASSLSAVICNGESYQFDGNSLTTSGTYSMRLQNTNGCDSTVVLNLSVTSLEVTATFNHDTLSASGGDNYTWINCANGNMVSTESSFNPTYSGSYAAIGSASGCIDTSNCVSVLVIGITETTANVISVHPNPFNNTTTITFSNNIQQYDIELYDLTGRIIATYKKQNTPTFILQRNNIAAGVYTLKIISNGNVLDTRKLVVE